MVFGFWKNQAGGLWESSEWASRALVPPVLLIPPCLRHEFRIRDFVKSPYGAENTWIFPELKNSKLEFWKNRAIFPELEFWVFEFWEFSNSKNPELMPLGTVLAVRFLSRKSKSKVVPYGRRITDWRIDGLLQSVTVSANTVTDYRIRINFLCFERSVRPLQDKKCKKFAMTNSLTDSSHISIQV